MIKLQLHFLKYLTYFESSKFVFVLKEKNREDMLNINLKKINMDQLNYQKYFKVV